MDARCRWRWKSKVPNWSPLTPLHGGGLITPGGWKPWQRVWAPYSSSRGEKSKLPTQTYWHGWEWAHRFLCGVWLEESSHCLKTVSVLLGCSFGSKEQASHGAFWGHTHWPVQASDFSAPGLGERRQNRKPRELTPYCSSGSRVPRWSAFSSPPLSFPVFILYCFILERVSVGLPLTGSVTLGRLPHASELLFLCTTALYYSFIGCFEEKMKFFSLRE